ncbi:protein clarinet-like isoform X2 [Chrysoperla carnea]|uniref:protein clarinet-like isoform X2 n=1 Tax=Chrysoperla carnea TaxID=189513 RepID=UPI001D0818BD|nr:protein clarinet-like isoform X2 [Chrysoperla carnea]
MHKLLTYILVLINLCEQISCNCIVYESDRKHITCRSETFSLINSVLDKESYEILTIEDPLDKAIPSYGINYPSLIELHLNNINIIYPSAFENLRRLEKLTISHSPEFTTLGKDALHYLEAEYLKINETNLETIEKGAFDTCRLVELDLSFNRIVSFENGLFDRLFLLETLILRSNNIKQLPPNIFANLENLERLDLSSNQLTYLPDELFLIDGGVLENINLANNNIQHISEKLFKGSYFLTTLNLSNNKMKTIGTNTFESCIDLKTLDLSGNNLGSNVSREDLGYLPSLITLSLDPGESSNTTENPIFFGSENSSSVTENTTILGSDDSSSITENTVLLDSSDSSTTTESSNNLYSSVTKEKIEKINSPVTEKVKIQTVTRPEIEEIELFTSSPKDMEIPVSEQEEVSLRPSNEINTTPRQHVNNIQSSINETALEATISTPSDNLLPPAVLYNKLVPPKPETIRVQTSNQIPFLSPVKGKSSERSGSQYPIIPILELSTIVSGKEISPPTTQKTINKINTPEKQTNYESEDEIRMKQSAAVPSSNPLLPPHPSQHQIDVVTDEQTLRTTSVQETINNHPDDIYSTPVQEQEIFQSEQEITTTPIQEEISSDGTISAPSDISSFIPSEQDQISDVTNTQTSRTSSVQETIDEYLGNLNYSLGQEEILDRTIPISSDQSGKQIPSILTQESVNKINIPEQQIDNESENENSTSQIPVPSSNPLLPPYQTQEKIPLEESISFPTTTQETVIKTNIPKQQTDNESGNENLEIEQTIPVPKRNPLLPPYQTKEKIPLEGNDSSPTTTQEADNKINIPKQQTDNKSGNENPFDQRIAVPPRNPLVPPYQTKEKIPLEENVSSPTITQEDDNKINIPKQQTDNESENEYLEIEQTIPVPKRNPLLPPYQTKEKIPLEGNDSYSTTTQEADNKINIPKQQTDNKSGNENPFDQRIAVPPRNPLVPPYQTNEKIPLEEKVSPPTTTQEADNKINIPKQQTDNESGNENPFDQEIAVPPRNPLVPPYQTKDKIPSVESISFWRERNHKGNLFPTNSIQGLSSIETAKYIPTTPPVHSNNEFHIIPILISDEPNKQNISKPVEEKVNTQAFPTRFVQETNTEKIPITSSQGTENEFSTINIAQTLDDKSNGENLNQPDEETTYLQTESDFPELETTTAERIVPINDPETTLFEIRGTRDYFDQTTEFEIRETRDDFDHQTEKLPAFGTGDHFNHQTEILPAFPTETVITKKPDDNAGGCLKKRAHWDFVNKALFYVCVLYKFILPQ